jgi:hypothetical protein
MIDNWQTPLALLVVSLAFVLLVRSAWKKRRKPGCGGDCGCPTENFKAKLRK